jgi:hypothetical protein
MQRIKKKNGEGFIINRFTKGYALTCGISLINIFTRERPDFEATIKESGQRIGIEVTGLYQNRREAMINYSEIPDWDIFTGSLDEILSSLNSLLEKKAALSYEYEFEGRLLLTIWAGSMVFNQLFDFKIIFDQIEVPLSRFDQIWLILKDEKGETTLILLSPS